jgi:3-oxoacyl-[acyl-carrier protein] reductase
LPGAVLVLGASGGIGGAIARELARAGYEVILHGRNAARLEHIAAGIGPSASIQLADLADEEQAGALMGRVAGGRGSLEGVVFSIATPFPRRLAHRTPWALFESQWASQVKALHAVAVAALPLLENSGRGRLVVVSSEAVMGMPPIKTAPYAAAKAGLTAYAQVIAQEWVGRGVRVFIVAPGLVKTDLTADMPDEFLGEMAARMPEKRLTSAEDVGRFVGFLMTDAAEPLYGTPLQVSRGERR